MVGTLGHQLYLRHLLGAVRAPRNRCRRQRAVDQARGAMAQVKTESRRWMGREPPLGPGSSMAWARNQHRLANRVGFDRVDRRRNRAQRSRDARSAVALRAAER